jgi:hypothetical protein
VRFSLFTAAGFKLFFTGEQPVEAKARRAFELLLWQRVWTAQRKVIENGFLDPRNRILIEHPGANQLDRELQKPNRRCVRAQADEPDQVMGLAAFPSVHQSLPKLRQSKLRWFSRERRPISERQPHLKHLGDAWTTPDLIGKQTSPTPLRRRIPDCL